MSISPQRKNIFQNKLHRGSSNMIGYQTWKYERNRFLDCCRPMSGFYWHLLLNCRLCQTPSVENIFKVFWLNYSYLYEVLDNFPFYLSFSGLLTRYCSICLTLLASGLIHVLHGRIVPHIFVSIVVVGIQIWSATSRRNKVQWGNDRFSNLGFINVR